MEAFLLQPKPLWSPIEISLLLLQCILCINPGPAIGSLMKKFLSLCVTHVQKLTH